jgi:hypothetical protein
MAKEVVKKESSEVALSTNVNDWGGSPITSQDIIIPRILVMQGLSEMVTDGDAKFGEFRESMNKELLGDSKNPVEFIPFLLEKVFIEYEDLKDEKKYLRMIPITPSNDSLPYQDEEKSAEGKMIKITRDRCMNFYVLLPKEIELGTAIPYMLSFRRTSIKAGKKLATQMYVKNINSGKTPAATTCLLTNTKSSNDKGTFAVLDIQASRASTQVEQVEAFKWLNLIKQGQAKVHAESFDEKEVNVSDLDNSQF